METFIADIKIAVSVLRYKQDTNHHYLIVSLQKCDLKILELIFASRLFILNDYVFYRKASGISRIYSYNISNILSSILIL